MPPTPAPVSEQAAILSFSTAAGRVSARAGGSEPLNKSLLNPAYPPRGGWWANIPVAGHVERVSGVSANDVFRKARALIDRNGAGLTDVNLWLNLNLQWLDPSRVLKPHMHPVAHEALMLVASGNAPQEPAHVSKSVSSPKEWGAKGWGMLQMELAQKEFDNDFFILLATRLGRWVNPDINPQLGCADCYRHYVQALHTLRSKASHTQDEARHWLFDLMNAVNRQNGRRELTFAEAAAINFWS